MKTRYAVALAFVAGAGFSGFAFNELHAQAKPQVYLVGEVEVTNMEGYSKEYSPKVRASVKAAGGRVVALGSAGEPKQNLISLEGAPAKRVFIQVWNDVDQMQAWYNGKQYKEARKIGDKYATFRHFVVTAVPQKPAN